MEIHPEYAYQTLAAASKGKERRGLKRPTCWSAAGPLLARCATPIACTPGFPNAQVGRQQTRRAAKRTEPSCAAGFCYRQLGYNYLAHRMYCRNGYSAVLSVHSSHLDESLFIGSTEYRMRVLGIILYNYRIVPKYSTTVHAWLLCHVLQVPGDRYMGALFLAFGRPLQLSKQKKC